MKPKTTIRAESDIADIAIFSPIGSEYPDGISAKEFIDVLNAVPASVGKIAVHVNSAGGNPFDAVTIAGALRNERRPVETVIHGLAASAATVITSAGSPIRILEAGLMMVHMPFSLTLGTAADHRQTATTLDAVADSIVLAYRWTSKLSAEKLRAMMEEVTWMDADSAIDNGFATEKIEKSEQAVAACASTPELRAALGEIPARYRDRFSRLVGSEQGNVAASWRSAFSRSRGRGFNAHKIYRDRNNSFFGGAS